jgi:hypothetical protein
MLTVMVMRSADFYPFRLSARRAHHDGMGANHRRHLEGLAEKQDLANDGRRADALARSPLGKADRHVLRPNEDQDLASARVRGVGLRHGDHPSVPDAHRISVALIRDHLARQKIGAADEIGDEGIDRRLVDLARGAHLDDVAIAHDDDEIGHGERFCLVMGHVDESRANPAMDLLDLALQALAKLLVERAQRLVHQQKPRP